MKTIFYILIALIISSNIISCTPERINDNVTPQACCDEEGTIPPPPPPLG